MPAACLACESVGCLRLLLFALGVLDGLVYREDGAGCFSSSTDYVDSDEFRFPHELLVHIAHSAVEHIDAEPDALFVLVVLLSELVEDVCGVHARVFGEGLRDDLEGLGEAVDDQLLLARDSSQVLSQVSGELHFDGTTAGNDGLGLDCSADNHDGVVEGSLRLFDVLVCASSEHYGAGFSACAVLEQVVSFIAELDLFEDAASAEDIRGQPIDSGLHDSASGLSQSLDIFLGDSASTEKPSVSEVLGGEISNGQLGEDDLSARGNDLVQLVIDQLPFSVHDLLVIIRVFKSDFGVLLLGLELKLQVQDADFRVLELLGLLLEASVGEGLLEGDTLD